MVIVSHLIFMTLWTLHVLTSPITQPIHACVGTHYGNTENYK